MGGIIERTPPVWYGVELRHLAALEAVAAERSFSAAAARLGYSQPAVSGQIHALERIVGARLFLRARGSRPLKLTAEGELLLEHARAISGRLAAARAELETLTRRARTALRIGVQEAVSPMVVPEALRRLAQEGVDVDVELRETYDVSSLLTALEQGAIDVVLTPLPIREGPFDATPIYRDGHVVVVRASDPLAARGRLTLDELGQIGLIAIDDCRAQAAVETALGAAGCRLNVVRRLEDKASILAFVSSGLGVGFLPERATELPDDLVALRLPAEVPTRVVVGLRHRELRPSAAAARFLELAASVGRRLALPAAA